jgi:hypothetical protein
MSVSSKFSQFLALTVLKLVTVPFAMQWDEALGMHRNLGVGSGQYHFSMRDFPRNSMEMCVSQLEARMYDSSLFRKSPCNTAQKCNAARVEAYVCIMGMLVARDTF